VGGGGWKSRASLLLRVHPLAAIALQVRKALGDRLYPGLDVDGEVSSAEQSFCTLTDAQNLYLPNLFAKSPTGNTSKLTHRIQIDYKLGVVEK